MAGSRRAGAKGACLGHQFLASEKAVTSKDSQNRHDATAPPYVAAQRINPRWRSSLRAGTQDKAGAHPQGGFGGGAAGAGTAEAPQQSVDEVETNMLQDFTQRMAARGTESNVRDAAQEYVDSVKSNVQVEQSGPSIVYVAGQAALLLLLLVGDVPVVGGAIETLLGPGLVVAGIGAISYGVLDLGAGTSRLSLRRSRTTS